MRGKVNGPRDLPGKRAKTMQCVASPMQGNRLHTATPQPNQCSVTVFLQAAEHFIRKFILATRATFTFLRSRRPFFIMPCRHFTFQAKSRTCSCGLTCSYKNGPQLHNSIFCVFFLAIGDICSPNPCENNGKCLPGQDGKLFICQCKPGFTGSRCECKQIFSLKHLRTFFFFLAFSICKKQSFISHRRSE